MTFHAHRLAVAVGLAALTGAASVVAMAPPEPAEIAVRSEPLPRAAAISPLDPERACAAAQDVLRQLAAGRAPAEASYDAQFGPADEAPEQTAIGVARTRVDELLMPLSCRCLEAECTASIGWDVHHFLDMTFAADDRKLRLVRVHSVAGGW